jgi:hypothetical protein
MTPRGRPGASYARNAGIAEAPSALAEIIVDQSVRAMYLRMLGLLRSLHRDVSVEESGVELRVDYGRHILCRVVPYRELLHVQVSEDPLWEVRVRDRAAFEETVERILRAYCRLAARAPGTPPAPGSSPAP